LGKTQLDGSGGCTQTARLSSIEKENGSGSTRAMGKIQSEKSGLELEGMTASVTSGGYSDAGSV
jgi:hypothetical protein